MNKKLRIKKLLLASSLLMSIVSSGCVSKKDEETDSNIQEIEEQNYYYLINRYEGKLLVLTGTAENIYKSGAVIISENDNLFCNSNIDIFYGTEEDLYVYINAVYKDDIEISFWSDIDSNKKLDLSK